MDKVQFTKCLRCIHRDDQQFDDWCGKHHQTTVTIILSTKKNRKIVGNCTGYQEQPQEKAA